MFIWIFNCLLVVISRSCCALWYTGTNILKERYVARVTKKTKTRYVSVSTGNYLDIFITLYFITLHFITLYIAILKCYN